MITNYQSRSFTNLVTILTFLAFYFKHYDKLTNPFTCPTLNGSHRSHSYAGPSPGQEWSLLPQKQSLSFIFTADILPSLWEIFDRNLFESLHILNAGSTGKSETWFTATHPLRASEVHLEDYFRIFRVEESNIFHLFGNIFVELHLA